MDLDDAEDLDTSEFDEILSVFGIEEPEMVGPDEEDLKLMGIELPNG